MEPMHVKHYLKANEFLEFAICAGACASAIATVYTALPKTNIYYCEVGKKGFDAPEDEPNKQSMECGLVLCLACYELRGVTYALVNSQNGAANGRSTRCRRK